jgi:ketosteroid isomerase-like protein
MTTQSRVGSEEAEVRKVIETRAEALRRRDPDGVAVHHEDGFVLYSLAPPLQSDTDIAGLKAWFDTWRGPLEYEFRDLSVTTAGDVAFSHGLTRLSGTKTDGQKNEIWFRHTLGFRKIGGTWKVVHEHESVPFYMDGSMRASVDLKP